jgi:hypothetical protein
MRRHVVLVVSAVVAVAGVRSAVIVAHAASTSSGYKARHGPGAGNSLATRDSCSVCLPV